MNTAALSRILAAFLFLLTTIAVLPPSSYGASPTNQKKGLISSTVYSAGRRFRPADISNDDNGALDLAADTLTKAAESASAGFEAVVVAAGPILDLQSTQPIALNLQALNLGFPVATFIVQYSLGNLVSTINQITTDHSDWLNAGIDVTSWGVDDLNDRVSITLADADSTAISRIQQAYGPIVAVSPTSRGRATRDAGRFDDSVPWYGGDKIEDFDAPDNVGACSSGFSVTDAAGGTDYVLTAAHCSGGPGSGGLPNHEVYNIKDNDSIHADMGSPTRRAFIDNGNLDAEAVKVASSGGLVWADGRSSTVTRNVAAVVDSNNVGNTFCTDGQRTGEVCAVLITDSMSCQEFTDSTDTCGLVTGNHSTPCSTGGDSGGPVYTATRYGAYAHGLVVGQYHLGNSYQCYYTPLHYIEDGLSIEITLD